MKSPETAVKSSEKTEDIDPAQEHSPTLRTAYIVYFIVFYAVWAVYELLIAPRFKSSISTASEELLKDGVFKNIVWTLPAILLIKRYDSQMRVSLREMFTTLPKIKDLIPALFLFSAYTLYAAMHNDGSLALSPEFGLWRIIDVIFIGITEETVFRGWLLNAMPESVFKGERGYWLSVGINAVMFLMIHFPIWIATGEFVHNFVSLVFMVLLVLSGIFGHSFLKTRSIWSAVLLHAYWDLMMFMFFG